jgi:WhiB family redox-sensing transcriptional regulator
VRTPQERLAIRAAIPPFAGDPAKACADVNPEVFFPSAHGLSAKLAIGRAKAICRRCPLREECAEWAIATEQGYGVFGGTTPNERAVIRTTRRRAA